ncbi:MAG: hypothetical protein R3F62_01040 [Planctomycetota bacterium]
MTEDALDPEAAALRARMHAGALPRARLELADALGHRPSRQALGRKDPEPPGPWDPPAPEPTLEAWGRRVGRFGGAIMLRVGTALCRHALAQGEPAPELSQGLAAADRFLGNPAEPGPDLEEAAKRAARATLTLGPDAPTRKLGLTLLPLLRAMLDVRRAGVPDQEQLKAHYLRLLEQAATLGLELEALEAAVRAEVVAWALAE